MRRFLPLWLILLTWSPGLTWATGGAGEDVQEPPTATLTPAHLLRGTTRTVILTAASLGDVLSVDIPGESQVSARLVGPGQDPETWLLSVTASEGAATGLRPLRVLHTGGEERYPDMLDVRPGPTAVLSVEAPPLRAGGDSASIVLRGRNLDQVASIDALPHVVLTLLPAGDDPRARTLTAQATSSANAGAYTLVLRRADGVRISVPDALSVTREDVSLRLIAPATLTRGVEHQVRLEGDGLDLVDEIVVLGRVQTSIVQRSADALTARFFVRDDARAGSVALAFVLRDGTYLPVIQRVSIMPGLPAITDVLPARVHREAAGTLMLRGRNLEEGSTIALGEGVTVEAFTTEEPTWVSVSYRVTADAPLGFRDILFESENGEVLLLDRLVVDDVVLPEPQITGDLDFRFPDTEVGTLHFATLRLRNEGTIEEVIVLQRTSGDEDILHFADTEDPLAAITERTLTLAPGASVDLPLRFAPAFRADSAVAFVLMAREGTTPAGLLTLRGRGIERRHAFQLPPPLRFGPYDPSPSVTLPRLVTRMAGSGQDALLTRIEEVQAVLRWNGDPVSADEAGLRWILGSTRDPNDDTPLWPDAELRWDVDVREGLLEGALLFVTDSPSARWVPYAFSVRGVPGAGLPDPPVEPRPEEEDVWVGDVQDEPGVDDASPDTDLRDDTDLPPPPAPRNDQGCCAALGQSSTPASWWTGALVFFALLCARRPRKRHRPTP